MADILEAVLARLSWPQDADHIVNIRSTLETIRSSLFTTLVDVQVSNNTLTVYIILITDHEQLVMSDMIPKISIPPIR